MKVKLDEGARMPLRAHRFDAGLDLFSPYDFLIYPNGSAVIDTGVHMEIPEHWYGKIENRSGLNINCDIVACGGGVIDSGYTGSIAVKLYNLGRRIYRVRTGDKIAQIIFMRCELPDELELVDELESTDRGDNGFGSTGR